MSLFETLNTLGMNTAFTTHVANPKDRETLVDLFDALGLGGLAGFVRPLPAPEAAEGKGRKCRRAKHCIVYANGEVAISYSLTPTPGEGSGFWSGTGADSGTSAFGGAVDFVVPDLTYVEAHALQCAINAQKPYNYSAPVEERVSAREMAAEIVAARGVK